MGILFRWNSSSYSSLFLGDEDYGAKLAIEIGNFKFQPSEFVKIIFVFFLAGYLAEHNKFKDVCISAVLAAIYVLILVASTDLGSALIFFMIYLFMLFVSTRNIIYLFLGAGGLSGASVIAYHLFHMCRRDLLHGEIHGQL